VVGSASGKKNILSHLGSMMGDSMGGDSASIDYDAATGTVQDAGSKFQSTCDGQLASALVTSNDLASHTQKRLDDELAKHKESLESIVDLQKNLVKTSTELTAERNALNQLNNRMTESLQAETARSKEEIDALRVRAQKDLDALRGEKDKTIALLKEESAGALESLKTSTKKDYDELKAEKDENIALLEGKLKMSSEELEEQMRLELKKAKENQETKVAEITSDRDAILAELTDRITKVTEDAAEVLKKTQEEAKAKLDAVETDRDTQLEALTKKMEEAAEDAKELLQTTKDEAKSFLLTQVETAKEENEKATTQYEAQLLETDKNIQHLKEFTEKILEKKAAVEKSLKEANAELLHWRELNSQRSYCNMTHVAVDVYDASIVAYNRASDTAAVVYEESRRIASAQVSGGLEYSNRVLNDKFEDHWPSISPFYEEHVADNYKTHLEPPLQKHVFPRLQKASSWSKEVGKPMVLRGIDDGKNSFNTRVVPVIERQYTKLARRYGNYCRHSLKEFLKATHEIGVLKDYPPPDFLLESWETSCENPRESMSALFQGTFVLLLVIFHRRVLRLAWSIFVFTFFFVIRFTPLRFVIPRRSTSKEIPSPPSSPSPLMTDASSDSLMKDHGEDENTNDDINGEAEAEVY